MCRKTLIQFSFKGTNKLNRLYLIVCTYSFLWIVLLSLSINSTINDNILIGLIMCVDMGIKFILSNLNLH